ncbi:MAG: cyclase family protein [Phycisphaerales bacterium]
MTIYDITPSLAPGIAVFPGDTPLTREVLMDMKRGDHITLSTLRTTVHVGAHADGANHYERDGRSIDEMPLEHYLGRCQVVRVEVDPRTRLSIDDFEDEITERRVLFATGSWPDSTKFNEDFSAFDPELVDALAASGVITIGIDTPSVDLADSKDLPAHAAFARNKVAILEGLDLSKVPPGDYELIALPLKLTGFDGSPVRAVLRSF